MFCLGPITSAVGTNRTTRGIADMGRTDQFGRE
jgi:hypothetical protein